MTRSAIPTTIAVLQLVEQGKIDLDAPVTTYLPYFQLKDEGYKEITVRQILENRSGLTDAGDIAQMWETYPAANDEGAVERFVRAMSQPSSLVVPRLAFAPGEGYQHSYTARIILGDIIQKVTGQTYEDYVKENIFAPLGMENSTILLDDVDPALLASPHVVNKDDTNFQTAEIVVSDLVPFSREFSASDNLYSNTEDMARLLEALLNGGELDGARILSPESVALMWTPSGDTSYDLQSWYTGKEHTIKIYGQYGMGGFIGEIADHPVYHTDGWQLGYRSDVALVPDQGLALIVMGNRGQNERLSYASDELYANNMIPDVLSMLLGVE